MARPKKIITPKEAVKIRSKKLINGNSSLYLDINHNGKRRYEFLKLYIIPDDAPNARTLNENTMQAAQAIKSRRLIELTNEKAGITAPLRSRLTLAEYGAAYMERKRKKGQKSVAEQIRYLFRHLAEWKMDGVKIADIDKRFCLQLSEKLKSSGLKQATQGHYFQAFGTLLNEAVRAEIIVVNPVSKLETSDKIRKVSPEREFLTADEVAKLIATPIRKKPTLCASWEILKQAFLFSCFCGLRVSDLRALRWQDIHQRQGYKEVRITMQKTRTELVLPLSDEALKWLPERPQYAKDSSPIFSRLDDYANRILKEWAENAGISKCISFHTARHSFATMLITYGADLYAVSKLLGHSDIQVTQIYAKVVDTRKVEAVNLLNGKFGAPQHIEGESCKE